MANLARNVSKMIYKVKSPKNGQFDQKSGKKCLKVKLPKNSQFGEKTVKNHEKC